MPAQHLGRADYVKVIGDEEGWELHITTEQGSWVVNVHGATHQLIGVGRELDAYWAEGRAAAAEHQLARYYTGANNQRADADAYPADDPKHPNWHSVHADLYPKDER